jgi:hypothetical protein
MPVSLAEYDTAIKSMSCTSCHPQEEEEEGEHNNQEV